MNVPRVSVLMSVFNEERFLAAAIESILGQTFRDFELLIVDDASTDRSRAIAASYTDPRIRLVHNPTNLGLTASLNRGLSMIRSDYVARLDGNDLSFPDRLAKQVAWLDAHPEVAVLGLQAVPIDLRGRRIRRVAWWNAHWLRPSGGLTMDWYRMFDTPLVHSGVVFRRDIVVRLGGYDERQTLAEDAELWMRVGRHAKLASLDEPLMAVRQDRSSLSGDPSRRERVGYAARKVPIIHALLSEILQWDEVPRRWAELWVEANDPAASMTPSDVRELAAALDTCATRFFDLHPEARSNRGIAAHRASMLARLIDKADRATALSLYRRMLTLHGRVATKFLPRVAVPLLFGHAPIRLWRRRPI